MQSRATTSTRPSPYAEIFEPITMRVVLQRQLTLRLKSTQTAILNVKFVFLFVRKQIEPYVLDKNRTDWLHEFFHIITLPEWVRFILKCNVIAD